MNLKFTSRTLNIQNSCLDSGGVMKVMFAKNELPEKSWPCTMINRTFSTAIKCLSDWSRIWGVKYLPCPRSPNGSISHLGGFMIQHNVNALWMRRTRRSRRRLYLFSKRSQKSEKGGGRASQYPENYLAISWRPLIRIWIHPNQYPSVMEKKNLNKVIASCLLMWNIKRK